MAILIAPGKTIGARMIWENRGPLPYAPQMRLHLRNSDFAATWQEGPWARSPQAAPGGRVTVEVSQVVPSNWDDKLIDVRVEIQDGGKRFESQQDDLFHCLAQRFKWPLGSAEAFNWSNPEHTWVYARWGPEHRGPAIAHTWVGFGIFPIAWDYDTMEIILPDPNNTTLYGSDVWHGVWADWADNLDWASWTWDFWAPFPIGFGRGTYALLWVVQLDSPADRGRRGEQPLQGEFGFEAFRWELDHILTKT